MTTQAFRSSFDDAAVAEADNEVLRGWLQRERVAPPTTGFHPFVIQISLSGVAWFLAVTWLDFSGGPQVSLALAVVLGFFVMYFTLFLLTASMVVNDPRWGLHKASFANFLKDQVPIDTGTMLGRDVLIQIALLPMVLAGGATLIGLIWPAVRAGW